MALRENAKLGAGVAGAMRVRVSLPRQILPGSTYLVTRRCAQRQFLLRPSRVTNQILRYCLAVAVERYGVKLHAYCFLSNHYHLVLTDPGACLPEMMRYLNEMIARALNASLGRWECVWAPGSYSAVRLIGPEDVLDKMAYALANPVAGGLVERGRDWPGLWSDPALLDAEPVEAVRPEGFFRADGPMPARCRLRWVRPAGFGCRAELVAALKQELVRRESQAAAQRRAEGRAVLGVAGIGRQRVTDVPSTVEPRRGLNPRIGALDRWKRIQALRRLKQFIDDYRRAWAWLRAGVASVLFPAGTYWLRVRHHVVCAPP
jgi:putative transposase